MNLDFDLPILNRRILAKQRIYFLFDLICVASSYLVHRKFLFSIILQLASTVQATSSSLEHVKPMKHSSYSFNVVWHFENSRFCVRFVVRRNRKVFEERANVSMHDVVASFATGVGRDSCIRLFRRAESPVDVRTV